MICGRTQVFPLENLSCLRENLFALLPWYAFSLFFFSVSMKCSDAALIFWTHIVLREKQQQQQSIIVLGGGRG